MMTFVQQNKIKPPKATQWLVMKSLHALMSWVLGAQVMMLFGELVETLGGRAQLEEEDNWDCVFDGYMWFLTPSLNYFLLAFATCSHPYDILCHCGSKTMGLTMY